MVNLIPDKNYLKSMQGTIPTDYEIKTLQDTSGLLLSQFGDGVHSILFLQKNLPKHNNNIKNFTISWIFCNETKIAKGFQFVDNHLNVEWNFSPEKKDLRANYRNGYELNDLSQDDSVGFSILFGSILKILYDFAEGYGSKDCEKFQKNRAKKALVNSKQKLGDDYYIITPEKTRPSIFIEETAGTHASPRYHMARGHWRHYKDGRKSWIKAHWKGDKEKGTIYKDYAVAGVI